MGKKYENGNFKKKNLKSLKFSQILKFSRKLKF
jgi:hypothetical protein